MTNRMDVIDPRVTYKSAYDLTYRGMIPSKVGSSMAKHSLGRGMLMEADSIEPKFLADALYLLLELLAFASI